MKLAGKNIFLRLLAIEDDLDNYFKWMNDPEVVRFTESKGRSYTKDDIKEYIRVVNNGNNRLFGIFLNESKQHVGNIKLGNIDYTNKRAYIGIIIGEKNLWGRGLATEAIPIAVDFAFTVLKLKKLYGGMYAVNVGSFKSFLKAGFTECGRQKEHHCADGQFIDNIMIEKINPGYDLL